MAELVYAFDLKSNGETRTGSSPVPATNFLLKSAILAFFRARSIRNSTSHEENTNLADFN